MTSARDPLTWCITKEYAEMPLQEVIVAIVGSTATTIIEHEGVWVDGKRQRDTTIVAREGMRITLHTPPDGYYSHCEIQPTDIVYEDRWLIALNKRSGWYVGATPWDTFGNVLYALQHFLTQRDGQEPILHLAHQLDRHTSGLLLISRDPQINKPLLEAFASHRVEKTYRALCSGEPISDTYELHDGHGRSRHGRWRLYPLDHVGTPLPSGGGVIKHAHTSLIVERRLGDSTLIRAIPHTGRTHQIRLHTAAIGHPLIGDSRYGGVSLWNEQPITGHLLHAAHLRLRHPATNNWLELTTPNPPWIELLTSR